MYAWFAFCLVFEALSAWLSIAGSDKTTLAVRI
jgi:hypothetical protein